uniref:Uncharacterized protein n=1 Tax=Haptolina ericina TaxID=156174 RepID=A0A7S3AP82_9EUKA
MSTLPTDLIVGTGCTAGCTALGCSAAATLGTVGATGGERCGTPHDVCGLFAPMSATMPPRPSATAAMCSAESCNAGRATLGTRRAAGEEAGEEAAGEEPIG